MTSVKKNKTKNKNKTKQNKTEKATTTTSIELNLATRTKDVITYGSSETRRFARKTNLYSYIRYRLWMRV